MVHLHVDDLVYTPPGSPVTEKHRFQGCFEVRWSHPLSHLTETPQGACGRDWRDNVYSPLPLSCFRGKE